MWSRNRFPLGLENRSLKQIRCTLKFTFDIKQWYNNYFAFSVKSWDSSIHYRSWASSTSLEWCLSCIPNSLFFLSAPHQRTKSLFFSLVGITCDDGSKTRDWDIWLLFTSVSSLCTVWTSWVHWYMDFFFNKHWKGFSLMIFITLFYPSLLLSIEYIIHI